MLNQVPIFYIASTFCMGISFPPRLKNVKALVTLLCPPLLCNIYQTALSVMGTSILNFRSTRSWMQKSGMLWFLWYVYILPKLGYLVGFWKMRLDKILFDQIDQEREGEQIDRALLKNVLDIFVEIGMGQMDRYENDFEAAMLKDTAAYYSRKASNWILEDSCPDYMLKVSFFCLYYIW